MKEKYSWEPMRGTIAWTWWEEGHIKGYEIGFRKGLDKVIRKRRKQGHRIGREEVFHELCEALIQQGGQRALVPLRDLALTVLKERFDPLPRWVGFAFKGGEIDDVKEWASRVYSVKSLEGLFAS